jgi:hypothetical protein
LLSTTIRFFALLDARVGDREAAMMLCLDLYIADPKPFVWNKSAGEILEKVTRANTKSRAYETSVTVATLAPQPPATIAGEK